jgi:thioredoxin reductase (NADPH)
LGDALHNEPELTPIAIRSGRLLARKLFNEMTKKGQKIDDSVFKVEYVPTTTFTNPEYGVIGFSEEEAIEKFGVENVKCYHRMSERLESMLFDEPDTGYFKVVCRVDSSSKEEHVVGMHFLGRNAGEIIQGYALGFQKGFTKQDLNQMVGIHPTVSEEFNNLTKDSKDGDLDSGSC